MKKRIRRAVCLLLVLATMLSLCSFASAVEQKTGIGIVQTDGLRLRAKASTGAEVLDHANEGDYVVIIRESGDFYLVDYNLQIGYMAKKYIEFKERENVELGYANVAEKSVNMRSLPASDGVLLTQLKPGDQPFIIGFNCGWYKVTFGSLTGYVRSDLLELTEKPVGNSDGAYSYVDPRQQVVDLADDYLGVPYVWGGTSTKGFDCSGFTQYVFNKLGYSLSRTASQQYNNDGVSVDEPQVGDLVFFKNTYESSLLVTHVGIYIGDGKFLHAGGDDVHITPMDNPYYAPRYVGAKRIV